MVSIAKNHGAGGLLALVSYGLRARAQPAVHNNMLPKGLGKPRGSRHRSFGRWVLTLEGFLFLFEVTELALQLVQSGPQADVFQGKPGGFSGGLDTAAAAGLFCCCESA